MSNQGSNVESPVSDAQLEDSGVKEKQQGIIALPKEGLIIVPFNGNIGEMESGLLSCINIQDIQVVTQELVMQCIHNSSSVQDWEWHFVKDTSNNSKMLTRWNKVATKNKLGVKKEPMKHKNLLKKRKLLCIPGNPKAKSLQWVKGILRIKEESSNLLRKSKIYCLQEKSPKWLKGIRSIQDENPNWVQSTDISLAFKDLIIDDCTYSPNSVNVNCYDMKALTDECENMAKENKITKDPIKECENLEEDIYKERREEEETSNEVNTYELAGYLDNMLHIPKDMSATAKSMYN